MLEINVSTENSHPRWKAPQIRKGNVIANVRTPGYGNQIGQRGGDTTEAPSGNLVVKIEQDIAQRIKEIGKRHEAQPFDARH